MLTINLKLIKDSDAPKEVIEVYKYLSAFRDQDKRAKWEKERNLNWDVIENNLWNEEEKEEFFKQKQIPIVDNKCNKGTQGRCAIVTSKKPEMMFSPIGSNDLYVAELLKRGHDIIWSKNDGGMTVYETCEESTISGVGVLYAYHDPNKGIFGREVFEEISPDNVFWDAQSKKRDWSDTHVLIAFLRTKSYIKDRYPEITDDDLTFNVVEKDKEHTSTGITTGDNYPTAEDQPGNDTIDAIEGEPANIWEIWAWLLKVKNDDWVIIEGPKKEDMPISEPMNLNKGEKPEDRVAQLKKENPKFKVIHWPRQLEKRTVRHIVGKKQIMQTDDNGNEVTELDNPHGEDADGDVIMPIIPLLGQRTRSGYPMGVVSYARDLNKISSKALLNFFHGAAHLINAPIIETDDAKWEGEPGTHGSRVKVPKNTPAHLIPRRMSPGAYQIEHWLNIKQVADQDIDDQFDTPDVMKGRVQEGQSNMSGRLGLALQDTADLMSNPFVSKTESSFVRLSKVNVALMLKNWHRVQWERLIEPDEMRKWRPEEEEISAEEEESGEISQEDQDKIQAKWEHALDVIDREVDMGKENIGGIIDIDVKIHAGSSMPTNRMLKMETAAVMVDKGIWAPETANEYIDFPFKDKAIALLKKQQERLMQQEMLGKAK